MNLSHDLSREVEKEGMGKDGDRERERGGEADKQEQWSPLCALIWARYSSSLSHQRT